MNTQPANGSVATVCSMCAAKSPSVRVGPSVGAMMQPHQISRLAVRHSVPCRMYSCSRPCTRPGPMGMSGYFRSSAWMPVFSSMLTTWMPCSASCPARSYRSQTASACSRKASGSSGLALSQ